MKPIGVLGRRCIATVLLLSGARCFAPPPLVTGDVPTAAKDLLEWYLGGRYQESESGRPVRLLPFTELVYGISDRQELTFETAGLSKDSHYGLADSVLGTKYVLLKETPARPGIAGSFELKLPTGDESRGLGTGEFDYDLRLRAQKTWDWFTAIGNLGYTFVTDPEFGGVTVNTENVWLITFGQEYQVARRTKLLSEIYFVSREEPSAHNRLAVNVGFKQKVLDNLTVHAAVGKSVREGNRGGPDLRIYAGLKWEFDAPWTRKKDRP
ncbi:MAG: transporter [Verrucomicrobia subdivision 3 bacterium]|nr:transporter [Limisphaerales bacterium]